jgi:hypothetical protein
MSLNDKKLLFTNHDKILRSLSKLLISLLNANKLDKNCFNNQISGQFNCKAVPEMGIFDYLLRIKKYTKLENSTLALALIYIDRICEKTGLILTELNIHK